MSPLEVSLVVLVSIWSLIFLILGVAIVILMRSIKKGVDRVNHIIETTDDAVTGVANTTRMATNGVTDLMSKVGLSAFTKIFKKAKKNSKSSNL